MSDNAFVGHYEAGNIQYNGHQSHGNNYSCTGKKLLIFTIDVAHIWLALPDHATFLVENTLFGQGVSLEVNHHCNVGTTGILCFPCTVEEDRFNEADLVPVGEITAAQCKSEPRRCFYSIATRCSACYEWWGTWALNLPSKLCFDGIIQVFLYYHCLAIFVIWALSLGSYMMVG